LPIINTSIKIKQYNYRYNTIKHLLFLPTPNH
jgi:hypothetical protein